ncbi:hypothetical protein [Nonomuraea candida]|uniref:hypothetical protein n=1 Tax=Nonomuraea candida TaxID=359159 RepID=UPI000693846E|nr:hypothetical protein [Nonomuraea candida]
MVNDIRRRVNRLRTQMRAQNRTTDDIAVEIRIQFGLTPLAAYRAALGLSQPEVVDQCRDQSPTMVMDQPLLSRLEMFPAFGSRAPLATHLITLASVYRTTPLTLLEPNALDRLDPQERDILIRCNPGFAAAPPSLGESTFSTSATAQVRLPAPGSLQEEVEVIARRAMRFATGAEGSNVGPEMLAQIRDEVAHIARLYPQRSLVHLMGSLAELQDMLFRLLEGRQRPAETTDLYLLSGIISGMLAKASHDLGNSHAAMTQARAAIVCAENAGHDGLRTWVRVLQSMIAYWAGSPREAARYVDAGAEYAARTRSTAAVWLPAQAARVWGVLGNAERVDEAILHAEHAREQVQPDELDEFGGIMTFTPPRQLYYAADARVWLPGQEHLAADSASAAIDAYAGADESEQSFSDEAGARADLALARIHLGDLDGAAEALATVLDLPVDQRIGGIVASTRRIHEALRAPNFRGGALAAGMQQEIEEFAGLPIQAALPPGQ